MVKDVDNTTRLCYSDDVLLAMNLGIVSAIWQVAPLSSVVLVLRLLYRVLELRLFSNLCRILSFGHVDG